MLCKMDNVFAADKRSLTVFFYKISRCKKANDIVVGGSDRQRSLRRGLNIIVENGGKPQDIVAIHDGVRPLVDLTTIQENIRVAKQYGCAITVHPVTETVVVTQAEEANMADFKRRSDTYSMTAPQTFQLGKIIEAYEKVDQSGEGEMPLLDAAMVYAPILLVNK